MAETKENKLEREYIIPLRRHWLRVPAYKRGGKAIKAIKSFIAKHMKISDRDVDKVKIDVYLNNELLFRGRKNPPSKIKVKAIKENDVVKVELAEVPQYIRFLKLKHLKAHKSSEKKPEEKETKEEKPAEKTEEQKKEESEKGKAVAEAGMQAAKQEAKAQKHITKSQKAARPQRMALQK